MAVYALTMCGVKAANSAVLVIRDGFKPLVTAIFNLTFAAIYRPLHSWLCFHGPSTFVPPSLRYGAALLFAGVTLCYLLFAAGDSPTGVNEASSIRLSDGLYLVALPLVRSRMI
jgi:hypothetical protein